MDKKKIHFKNDSLIFKVTLVLVNVSISRYFSDVMEEKHFFFCFKIHKNVDDPEIISEIDSLVKNQKDDLCTHSWLSIRYWKIWPMCLNLSVLNHSVFLKVYLTNLGINGP